MMAWLVLLAALGILSVGMAAATRAAMAPALPDLSATSAPAHPPRCAVVIAARDENQGIAATVAAMLAQVKVELSRVVVVDDRSTDGTGATLDRLAQGDPRLDVVHVQELPEGWLGKTHACARGAERVPEDVDWILFADADTRLEPDALARALELAARGQTDHVCALPDLADTTAMGRAVVITMCVGLFGQHPGPNTDHPRSYFGVGSFNLIRHAAYRDVGGHAGIRMEILEDLRIGRALRQAGYRTRVAFAEGAVRVHWITDLRSFFRLTEKNYFAAVDHSVPRAVLFIAFVLSIWTATIFGPLLAGPPGWIGPMCFLTLIIAGCVVARRYRWNLAHGLLVPLVFPIAPLGLAWSTYCNLRHGIRWRGTTYPSPRRG